MKSLLLIVAVIFEFNIHAEQKWLQAKDNMICNTADHTIESLSNYLIKNAVHEAVDSFFTNIGVKYHKDSLKVDMLEHTSTDTLKEVYVGGDLLTRKGSLVKITDQNLSTAQSTLLVKIATKETEKIEYDREGIPVSRLWVCAVSVVSGDLVFNLLNQSQNDYMIGNAKVKINKTYNYEKREKL